MSSPTARVLRLLSLLQSRSVRSGADLAAQLGVTERTVRRDVDRLRELGYPVLTSAGHGGGYRLGSGRSLPPLLLDADAATAVAVGLRLAVTSGVAGLEEHALRALSILDPVMPPGVRAQVSALSESASVLGGEGPSADPQAVLTIARAVRDRVQLRMEYTRADGERSQRRLEPYRLVAVIDRWYLYAFDLDREDWRTFRVDRITSVRASTFTFTPRETGDVEQAVHESIAAGGYDTAVRVRLGRPASEVSTLMPVGAAVVEPDGPDRCLLTTGARELSDIAWHLLRLKAHIEVIEPPQLVDELQRLGQWGTEATLAEPGKASSSAGVSTVRRAAP